MALFKITVKMSKHCDGMVIEPGMSIQYAAFFSNVLSNDKERVSPKTQLQAYSLKRIIS